MLENLDLINKQENIQPPLAEFEGYAECPIFSENVTISLTEKELVISALFDQLVLPYSEIISFSFENYRVSVYSAETSVSFSRMGQQAEWFYDKLCQAYNNAVLKALNVSGEHLFEANGTFMLEEESKISENGAIRLYENCICLLPSNENARRIPLCFITGMEKSDYALTFVLSSGERYTVSKMGRELDNFERIFVQNMRKLREKTTAWHKDLAPNLSTLQTSAAAKLMPLGTAAELNALAVSAPLLADVIEFKVSGSRIAQTYLWLKKLCGDDSLTVGAKPAPPKEETMGAESESINSEAEPLPILWIAAPDREKKIAAVELALAESEAAATYLYRIYGKWDIFSKQIDRAMEAADFRRELITLTEEKLRLPENAESLMMIKRTPSLQLLRKCFAGKAIHSSQERWLRDIEKASVSSNNAEVQKNDLKPRFCTNCGSALGSGMRFCGQCGTKIC